MFLNIFWVKLWVEDMKPFSEIHVMKIVFGVVPGGKLVLFSPLFVDWDGWGLAGPGTDDTQCQRDRGADLRALPTHRCCL